MSSTEEIQTPERVGAERGSQSIGHIIAEANQLKPDDVERILAHQRATGLRFGEAAVALGLVRDEDVVWALSQQFHFPYAAGSEARSSEELVLAHKPFSAQAEAFRVLRSQLMMRVFASATPRPALAVISPDSGDGKSFFAANLAAALSQLGGRTLLVDADMRNPRQHELCGVDGASGLSGVLAGRPESGVIRAVPELPSLFVLPVGTRPPNPSELVERPAFGLLMNELRAKFDYVVIDTPAASYGADYAVIAARAGAALALARRDRSRVAGLRAMTDSLKNTPATLHGVVLNEF